MSTEPLKIFYSYSHKDTDMRNKLSAHLAGLVHTKAIQEWYDGNIIGGTEWNKQIDDHMLTADLILLLISPDFMKSRFCYQIETAIAFEQRKSRNAHIIPIMLRPAVIAEGEKLSALQFLPQVDKPVTSKAWGRQDVAFVEVVKGITKVIKEIRKPKVDVGIRMPRGDQTTAARPGEVLTTVTTAPVEAQKKCAISNELPFYCDRLGQDQKLKAALSKRPHRSRPFVCIVHGDNQECPEKYIDRLRSSTLPEALSLDTTKYFIDHYPLELPKDPSDPDEALAVMRMNLGKYFGGAQASIDTIAASLDLKLTPVFIYSILSSLMRTSEFTALVNLFVRFWSEFPVSTSDHLRIACLVIEHEESLGQRRKQQITRFLTRLFSPTLATNGAANASASLGIVLPELSPIKLPDVREWLRLGKDFRGIGQDHEPAFCNPDEAIAKMEAKYREAGQAIAMRQLAPHLKEVLCQTCGCAALRQSVAQAAGSTQRSTL